MAAKKRAAKKRADFEDEGDVLREFAKAEGEDADSLRIKPDSGLESFGVASPIYRITTPGGNHEWTVVEDETAAYDLAIAVVTQDLESEPEIFSQDFIESHINMDRLRRDLHNDVRDMAEEELRDMRDSDFWRTAERYIDVPEEDDEGEMPDSDDFVEDVAEKMAEERLKDPMDYLSDIYGKEDAVKQAIQIAGIDITAAAEDAVDTDGWQHPLARYDGNSSETASGFVYWRDN